MAPKMPLLAIIENDDGFRAALAGLLKSYGYLTKEFSGAQEFLDSGCSSTASCVISDVQMAEMSGLELHQLIAVQPRPIPTILITGLPSSEDRQRALKAGVTCYLAKPLDEQDLVACIEKALGTSHS